MKGTQRNVYCLEMHLKVGRAAQNLLRLGHTKAREKEHVVIKLCDCGDMPCSIAKSNLKKLQDYTNTPVLHIHTHLTRHAHPHTTPSLQLFQDAANV